MTEFPDNLVDLLNTQLGGHNEALGLRFVEARPDAFTAELEVGPQHHQPYGLVHGGVYAAMVETVCSTAAAITVFADGKHAVGLDNSTSFLKAVRQGVLRCTATPRLRGRRSQVWEAEVHDGEGNLVAIGRVRLMVLEDGAAAGGQTVGLQDE